MNKIPLNQVNFPKLFLDYIEKNESLSEFYSQFPTLECFKSQIKGRNFNHRQVLFDALTSQYAHLSGPKPDLELLKEKNTFTVTTGHQLNIFTGPLYVILKLVSTINLAKKLKRTYPMYNFVPVYWMATEDHDFEEINHFYLFGNKLQWNSSQTGAVGRFDPKGIMDIEGLRDIPSFFEHAYGNQSTLANAVRYYVNELFGSEGLICIDGDDKSLKTLFKDQIKNDLKVHHAEKAVSASTNKLEQLGYKTQISARNINLFYLDAGVRERIEKQGENYIVLNTDLSFDSNQILALVEDSPEKFSPNVVLRPLYQETILPNLAYFGGPSEVAYWLQLKSLFELEGIPFPLIMPRNFAMVVNGAMQKKLQKIDVQPSDLFRDNLKAWYLAKISENTLSLNEEIEAFDAVFNLLFAKTQKIDPSLIGTAEAEKSKLKSNIENFEKRLKKAEEKKYEVSIGQLEGIKEKLFPDKGLQERKENFLNFYINDPLFIQKLLETLDPLCFDFNLVEI